MKYFKQYKDEAKGFEITKEEARNALEGHWDKEMLDDIFCNNKGFRLYTPFSEIWTVSDDGLVPMAGFYGIVG